MHVIQIAPPHLETNDSPSLALRVCHEADSALVGYLAGNDDFCESMDSLLNSLRPSPQRLSFLLAACEQEGQLRAQEDETDLGARGFLRVNMPLTGETTLAYLAPIFVDDYSEEVLDALLDAAAELMAQHGRTTITLDVDFAIGGLDDDPRAAAFTGHGFVLGIVEQACQLELAKAEPAQLPAGLRAEYFEGHLLPEHLSDHTDSFLEILSIADLDVPTAEGPIEREWTEEMLQEAAKHHARSKTVTANAVLIDEEGIAALSVLLLDPSHPEVAKQELTITHRRARGRGWGMLVKQALWGEIAARYPRLKRVTTYNALSNERMLAINAKLGIEPKFWWTSWTKSLAS